MMKRITITLEQEMYLQLLDFALKRSKQELRSYSMSEAIRDLLKDPLERLESPSPNMERSLAPARMSNRS
jgi:metal-responsive CopG/Arc/MetJ family transcriptional regulator